MKPEQKFLEQFRELYPAVLNEREALHFPRMAEDLASIISIEDLERSLTIEGLGYPAAKMLTSRDGIKIQPFAGTLNAVSRKHMSSAVLKKLLYARYSILFPKMHQIYPAVYALYRSCSEIAPKVQGIGGILTPPGGQATIPHADDHAILVVQVQGVKRWMVWDIVPEKEIQQCRDGEELDLLFAKKASLPSREIWLQTGDAMFVPKRALHTASAMDSFSLSLSIKFERIAEVPVDRCEEYCTVLS